jgi:hypothetical protein
LLHRPSTTADSDDMIRRRLITEEEWNGAPHAYQKTSDDPNNLGRYKLAFRRKRRLNGLKRVEWARVRVLIMLDVCSSMELYCFVHEISVW